jgi:hypothetical protein
VNDAVSDMDRAIVSGHGPAVLSDIEGRRPLVGEEDVVVVYDLAAVRELRTGTAVAQTLEGLLGMAGSPASGSISTPTFSTIPRCRPWTTVCPAGSARPS